MMALEAEKKPDAVVRKRHGWFWLLYANEPHDLNDSFWQKLAKNGERFIPTDGNFPGPIDIKDVENVD